MDSSLPNSTHLESICAMVKSRVFLGMVISPLIGNPYNGYINPYYWVDDHPLLYGNNGSGSTLAHMKSRHRCLQQIIWGMFLKIPDHESCGNFCDTADASEIRRSHQLVGSFSHYLQGFVDPRCCRISAINSMKSWEPKGTPPRNKALLRDY